MKLTTYCVKIFILDRNTIEAYYEFDWSYWDIGDIPD